MIKNLFLLLVVCAAVLFGGKYYIENRYEKEIDKAVRTYGVPVSYKNVELDFDGSLSLNGLKMTMPERSPRVTSLTSVFIYCTKFLNRYLAATPKITMRI